MKRSPKLTAALSVLLVSSSYGQSQRTPRLSDNDIELEVQQALADAAFNGSSIQSAVNAGVVKLYGNVRTNDEKTLAEAKITNLRGVKSINDLLTVIDRTPAPVAGHHAYSRRSKDCERSTGNNNPIRLTGEIDTKTAAAGDSFRRHHSRKRQQRRCRRDSDRNASDRTGYRSQSSRSSQWSRRAQHRAGESQTACPRRPAAGRFHRH